ncbi:hypothetical protein Poly51_62420 [Rubripirellula tenax]|uniref:Uncharacterized protein n=1 Tax=Rubripirellula tenax TaxID=2528015 RepID=A0A5C6E204_9BACT|nr:hypothetical protein Poly51_62420 [Rubripirellula tenax]
MGTIAGWCGNKSSESLAGSRHLCAPTGASPAEARRSLVAVEGKPISRAIVSVRACLDGTSNDGYRANRNSASASVRACPGGANNWQLPSLHQRAHLFHSFLLGSPLWACPGGINDSWLPLVDRFCNLVSQCNRIRFGIEFLNLDHHQLAAEFGQDDAGLAGVD